MSRNERKFIAIFRSSFIILLYCSNIEIIDFKKVLELVAETVPFFY